MLTSDAVDAHSPISRENHRLVTGTSLALALEHLLDVEFVMVLFQVTPVKISAKHGSH